MLVLMVTLVAPALAHADGLGESEARNNKSGVGLQARGSMSIFGGDDLDLPGIIDLEYTAQSGGQLGVFLRHAINPYFAFQPEAHLTFKGTDYEVRAFNGTLSRTGEVTLTYVEAALLGRITTDTGKGWDPYLLVGPSLAVPVMAHARTTDRDGDTQSEDITDDMAKYELSAVVGIGARIELSRRALLIEGRYQHGLSDVDNDENQYTNVRVFSLGAGWEF